MAGFYLGCFVGAAALYGAQVAWRVICDSLTAAPPRSRFGAGLEDD